MKKMSLLLLFAFLFTLSSAAVPPEAEVAAPSAILMERSSGQILYEKNSHEHMAPASVTKIMTMLLLIESMEDGRVSEDDMVTTSDHAASMGGSQIYLEPGEQMTVRDMLKSVAVASANDACVALAEHIAGSESAFVTLMNDRAAALGMEDTHFANCCGLDTEGHYTTAYDIALMSRELLKHDKIKEYTTIWMDSVRDGAFGLTNTNKLVRFYDGSTGLKTGYTSNAGYCVSASAVRNGMELIAVVMKSDTSPHRNADASGLLNFGFANFAVVGADENDVPNEPIPVELGCCKQVNAELKENSGVLIGKADAPKVQKTLRIEEKLTAPVEKGQQVGTLTYTLDDQVLAEVPVVAAENVERLSFLDIYGNTLRDILMR